MQVCLPTKNDLMMSLTIFITFNIEDSDEFSWHVKLFISSKCLKHFQASPVHEFFYQTWCGFALCLFSYYFFLHFLVFFFVEYMYINKMCIFHIHVEIWEFRQRGDMYVCWWALIIGTQIINHCSLHRDSYDSEIVGKLIQIFKLHQQWNLMSRVDLCVDAWGSLHSSPFWY